MQGLRTEHLTPISELAIRFDELKCEDDDPVATQAMPPERITPAEGVGLLIVAPEKQGRGRAATESTLSSAVKIVVEGTAALSSVASQSETYENTARTLESIEVYICRSQALEEENAKLIEELKNARAEKADAVERTRILEEMRLQGEPDITLSTAKMLEMLQAHTDGSQSLGAVNTRLSEELVNERVEKAAAFERARILEEERLQRESKVAQSAARMLKMLQTYTGQNQTLGAVNARLREELNNERAEKAADFERTRALDVKLQTEPERLQIESGIQKTEAAVWDPENRSCSDTTSRRLSGSGVRHCCSATTIPGLPCSPVRNFREKCRACCTPI
uniref:Uncharacterized protein n=1 Tax=Arundo donax TaxID=35708 RepID=A0A0A8XWB0_ARUDO